MTDSNDFTPIVRLSLKKGDPWARVREDVKLSESSLMLALGDHAEAAMKLALMKRSPDKVVMFQQGEVGDSLYFVVSGTVRLFARQDKDSLELPSIGAGDVIGEAEVLGGTAVRHQSAVAQGVVELIELPRKSLLVNGMLPPALESLLNRVRKTRAAQLDELTNFMNRW